MSSSIIFKSKSLLTSSIRHHSSRLSRSCIHKQFNSYANPLYRQVSQNPLHIPSLLKTPSLPFVPVLSIDSTSAKGFDGRERSEESRYAREKEVAELKELLAKQNAKIEELEKNVYVHGTKFQRNRYP
ncbi:hypothetical protein PSTT_02693 [Puccinia striiformis]|uniref:Uncharacterized protein n=1 Tax=Puccinia striiformis TaxID=27350 RepID=A0A2S4VZ24_9BASI|nr:hypothetical protein PSTT_02693 [Puccinia striiformis]